MMITIEQLTKAARKENKLRVLIYGIGSIDDSKKDIQYPLTKLKDACNEGCVIDAVYSSSCATGSIDREAIERYTFIKSSDVTKGLVFHDVSKLKCKENTLEGFDKAQNHLIKYAAMDFTNVLHLMTKADLEYLPTFLRNRALDKCVLNLHCHFEDIKNSVLLCGNKLYPEYLRMLSNIESVIIDKRIVFNSLFAVTSKHISNDNKV